MWTDRLATKQGSISRELERLDPERDNERMTHLLVEVRYGNSIFAAVVYTLAFMRQMSIPSIMRPVYRRGTGDIVRATRQRNDDTLVFFGEIMRSGHSSGRGAEVIDRMNEIHARYKIDNHQNLYTLASLILEAQRIGDALGMEVMSSRERDALYYFWRGVGERMGITDFPATKEEFLEWVLQYERDNAAYSEGGALIARLLLDDLALRFPKPLRWASTPLVLALCDEGLLRAHRLPRPPRWQRALGVAAMRGFLVGVRVLPDPPDRSWVDQFGADTAYPDFARIGQQRVGPRRTAEPDHAEPDHAEIEQAV
ncbi:oxygenase MpaB family protein [Nocardia aurantiaca]|nr:oxygenase MpaB family protein [Nocardia aurantiaca]